MFRETASRLIRTGAGEPPPTPAEAAARARRVLELASAEVLSKGITSFQDAGSSLADVDLMKKMIDEGKIAQPPVGDAASRATRCSRPNLAKYKTIDYGDGFLTVRAIKKAIDGALGPRGAWLLEPYADKPGDTGRNTTPVAEIAETARLALEHGYQLCVHAIGDRANRETLDIFEQAFKGARRQGAALARRACAAPQCRGHPALRQARRDRVDAGRALHVRRAVRAGPPRSAARRRRRVRLAEADEVGGAS